MNIPIASYIALLSDYLKPQFRRVLLLAGLICVDIALQLIGPQIIRRFIDVAQTGAPASLTHIALLYIGIALVQQGLSVCATYISENVGWIATNALRSNLARHCLGLDMGFHNNRTPGEMIERIDSDIQSMGNFFSLFAIQIVANLVLVVGILGLLFAEDWRAGLGLTAFALASFALAGGLRNIAVPHMIATQQASADIFGFLEERLAGAEDIRANRAVPYVLRRFFELARIWLQKQIKTALMVNVLISSQFITWAIGMAVALGLGAYLYTQDVFTLGATYLLFHYTTMLLRPIERITYQLEDLQRAGASVSRVREFSSIQTAIPAGRGDVAPPGSLAVKFQNVTFGYAPGEPVIKDLTFSLAPGRVLGLLGRTGSGKTTLTRLLFRLCDPWEGRICLNGADLRHADLNAIKPRLGLVSQNVQLFQATLRDNLTLFDEAIPDDRICAVLKDLSLEAWYRSLPQGLDTPLNDDLSAGEAQLLAFARVFLLKNPDLVMLDEASSRLDPATEQRVERAVDQLVAGRTAIVIAHRLHTVRRADDILILDQGRLVEYGPRAQLERDPHSRFAHLLRTGMEDVLS